MKTWLKKLITVLLCLLFILFAVPTLVLINIESQILSPQTLQNALQAAGLYERIPSLLAQAILSDPGNVASLPPVLRGLDARLLEQFIGTALPESIFQQITQDALASAITFLNRETDTANLSLVPLKTSLSGQAGLDAFISLMEAYPACTKIALTRISANLKAGGDIAWCLPPAKALPLLTPSIQEQLKVASMALPDQVMLLSARHDAGRRFKLDAARPGVQYSLLIPLALLLLTSLLTVRTLKGWLGWWVAPFIISGLLAIGLSMSDVSGVAGLLEDFFAYQGAAASMPAFVKDTMFIFLRAALHIALPPLFWQGLSLAGIGFIMAGIYQQLSQPTPAEVQAKN